MDTIIDINNELNYTDLNDFYISEGKGFGLSTNVGASTSQNETNLHPSGSTTLSLKSTGEEKEQITRATIGSGNIIVADKINDEELITLMDENNNSLLDKNGNLMTNQEQLLAGLNRDVTNSQEITKDMITGALDGSVTIDNRLFSEDGRKQIVKEQEEMGKNLLIGFYGATNTIYNVGETIYQVATNNAIGITDTVDVWKANQSQQVTALTRGANEEARETLNNLSEGQDINDIEEALALGVDEKGTKIYYNEETDKETQGFNNKDTKQSYINAGSIDDNGNDIITNTNSVIGIDAHERSHTYTDNEAIANIASNAAQTAWTVTNWIYGDSINTAGTATSQSWLNSQLSNYNSTSTLLNNTISASSVGKENRDNYTQVKMNAEGTKGTVIDAEKDGDRNIYDENDNKIGETLYDDDYVNREGDEINFDTEIGKILGENGLYGDNANEMINSLLYFEGNVDTPYVDSVGKLTIGIGKLIDDESGNLIQNIDIRDKNGNFLSTDEKLDLFNVLLDIKNTNLKYDYNVITGKYEIDKNTVKLTNEVLKSEGYTIDVIDKYKIFIEDIRDSQAKSVVDFDNYTSIPTASKIVIDQMEYNMGSNFTETKWPNFYEAVSEQNWLKASQETDRNVQPSRTNYEKTLLQEAMYNDTNKLNNYMYKNVDIKSLIRDVKKIEQ